MGQDKSISFKKFMIFADNFITFGNKLVWGRG